MVPDLRICGPSLFLDLGVGGHSLWWTEPERKVVS
jgi:hypothetical protein